MPKTLFYIGIVCCVFLAVAAGGMFTQEAEGGPLSFVALHGNGMVTGSAAAWAIVVALLAAVAVASIFLRMAALLAARNLFGAFLALRPYFRIQASRFLSALVFFPLPLFMLIVIQELFVTASAAPLPAITPASMVFFGVIAMLFFSIGVHCVRHRHMFIEMTNLRELLEPRIDPARARAVGRVAFDS